LDNVGVWLLHQEPVHSLLTLDNFGALFCLCNLLRVGVVESVGTLEDDVGPDAEDMACSARRDEIIGGERGKGLESRGSMMDP
jgi:hypothetical protein